MGDRQDNNSFQQAERDDTCLTIVGPVINQIDRRTVEDQLSLLKTDAVLRNVGTALVLIPLEPHAQLMQ